MTLVQLRHFIALIDTGSFARASRALHLTQPALSRSIQALEETLGAPLFDRLGRRIEPTAMALQWLPHARRLLQDADALKTMGRRMEAGLTGTVRIGLGSGPGAMLSVPMLTHMARHHPQWHLEVARGGTDLLVHALRQQRLDAVVVDIRALRPASDLRVSHRVEMSAGFLCRAGHPLTAGPLPVPFAALLAYPIASTPLSDEVARLLTERYGPLAIPDQMVTLRCDDTQTLVEVARHTDAVVLTIHAAAPDLVRLPVTPALEGTARFGLVTLDQRAEVPGLDWIRGLVQRWLCDSGAA
jgi:DNA-binding transcriptional LysR family regulator